jgi:chromosomal replication initiator protein
VPGPRPATISRFLGPFLVLSENAVARQGVLDLVAGNVPLLFLAGPTGTGKSHLLNELVDRWQASHPRTTVLNYDAVRYSEEFAKAVADKKIAQFQQKTRKADLFVLDDAHLLATKPETQQQLIATLDDLRETCRFAFAAQAPPGQLAGCERRLVNRWRGGLLATLRRPGPDSRISLVRHFAAQREVTLPEDLIEAIGRELSATPREIYATLVRLESRSRAERRPLDRSLFEAWRAEGTAAGRVTVPAVARAVAKRFGVTVTRLRARERFQGINAARQCAIGLARELTGLSLAEIGEYFGGRDHSTILHACERFRTLEATDAETQRALYAIRGELTSERG